MDGDSTESERHEGAADQSGWDPDPPAVDDDILEGLMGGSIARSGGILPDAFGSRGGGSAVSHQSVPAFVGGQGAGSSVASRSVIPTENYFNESARRSHREILERKVICPKEKRGPQGSRDYCRTHAAATAALPELFGAAKHFRTKNFDGELAYKYKDIQSEYVGNLDKLKLLRKLMIAYDLYNPFMVPLWIEPQAIGVMNRWGDRGSDSIDLLKHWSQVSLEHVCAWQRDTFDWCNDNEDLTSIEWVKELLTNSCDINLVKRIDEKFE